MLHIGLHKTGTTTLQHYLSGNAEALAAEGLHYPKIGRSRQAHHQLANQIRRDGPQHPHLGTWEDVLSFVADHPLDKIIISGEGFGTFKARSIQTLKREIGLYPTRVIAYTRHFANLLPSAYGQKVKKGAYIHDFDHFYQNEGSSRLGFSRRFLAWREVGIRNVTIRPIGMSGDVIIDFNELLELLFDFGVRQVGRNVGDKWITLEVVRAINSAIYEHIRKDIRSSKRLHRGTSNFVLTSARNVGIDFRF